VCSEGPLCRATESGVFALPKLKPATGCQKCGLDLITATDNRLASLDQSLSDRLEALLYAVLRLDLLEEDDMIIRVIGQRPLCRHEPILPIKSQRSCIVSRDLHDNRSELIVFGPLEGNVHHPPGDSAASAFWSNPHLH
jgi:hypothetical protein